MTRGKSVTTGRPVLVAVIDSGLDRRHPQLQKLNLAAPFDATTGRSVGPNGLIDCVGHGTGVASIIGAQPGRGIKFSGVAPDAKILPIKETDPQGAGTSESLARAIDAAVAAHARVANLSLGVLNPVPSLRAALDRAAKEGMVIVAAAGNDGANTANTNAPSYPAAYAPDYPNIIAVSATDASDSVGNFSTRGSYVSVAAPGTGVEVAARVSGYSTQTGTSFAAPFVTGTVALMLAAHPTMSPVQVRRRLEATADRPPVDVPNPQYGYGIINPYLAVTEVRHDAAPVATANTAPPLAAPVLPAVADRRLAHRALAVAVVLLGLAVLTAAAAAVLRGTRPSPFAD